MLRWTSWTEVSSTADLAVFYGGCSSVVLANSARGTGHESSPPPPVRTGFKAAAGSLALGVCRFPPPPLGAGCGGADPTAGLVLNKYLRVA